MDQKRRNPFRPGAGEIPPHRAGHEAAVGELAERVERVAAKEPGGMVILYGPRGNGKTALLDKLEEMAKGHSVRVAELDTAAMGGDSDSLAEMLDPENESPPPLTGKLRVGVPGLEGEVEFNPPRETTSLGKTLCALLRDPLVLMIDEAHDMPPGNGKLLLQIAQRLIRHKLPLLLVLAGTPGIRESLRRIGASFWERARRLKIGRLETRDAVRKALSIPAEESGLPFATEALELLVDESQSYPFFIQLLGEQAWAAAIARDPGTGRIELEDAQAGVRLAEQHRRDFCVERRKEAKTRKILPEAEAVSKAFDKLKGDGVLSEAQVEDAIRPVLSEGRTVDVALEELSALGLIWDPRDLAWEQGIPSLCAYLARNAR